MLWRALFSLGVLTVVGSFSLFSVPSSQAKSSSKPSWAGSPHNLVDAVNALRASFGLAPYSINPILMSTAQAQADFLAATGSMTHAGPGGIGLTDRLLAAGYPLAGDLSLGGFRAENITGGDETMPPEAAVDRWTGDALHLNTMVSQYLTEIGAGVAVSGGRVYYVIDCASPTTSSASPAAGTPVDGPSPVPETSLVIIPVLVSTPNAEGNVFHEVRPGQTLWQIAITYEVKIDDIKRLNNLFNNNIYPGSSLLIKQGTIVSTVSPTKDPTQGATSTGLPTLTLSAGEITQTATPGAASQSGSANDQTVLNVMIGIIALAVVGGGLLTWLGSSRKK